jgi:hypothetical protein
MMEVALSLVRDTGRSSSDRITSDPRLKGTVNNLPQNGIHPKIEFDRLATL